MAVKRSDVDVNLLTPREVLRQVGRQAAALRLTLGRRQVDVARAAGVALPTLRRFEAGINVGFDAVVKVAMALGAERSFGSLFPAHDVRTFDQILRENEPTPRQRARTRPRR